MIATATTTIRHLQYSDKLPTDLWLGREYLLNAHWVWVAVDDNDNLLAVLITAPAHSAVILLRLWANSDAPPMTIRKLFREAARECLQLGMLSWVTMLEATSSTELKLVRMVMRYKGGPKPFSGYVCAGRLDQVCLGQQ